jgi:hypothetical protein
MPEIDVHLRFGSDHDREVVLARLRSMLPEGVLVTDGDKALLRLDAEEERAAVVMSNRRVRDACRGTDVDHHSVRQKPWGWDD